MNDDILSMPKGWILHYTDGTIVTEYDRDGNQKNWRKYPKVGIKSLSLKWNTKFWTIANKECYLQKKRAWVSPQPGEQEANVQYRYIGYWEGNDRVFYQVDEITGQMAMVVDTLGTGTVKK